MSQNFLDDPSGENPSAGESTGIAYPAPTPKKKGKAASAEATEAPAAPAPAAPTQDPIAAAFAGQGYQWKDQIGGSTVAAKPALDPKPMGNTNMDQARASVPDLQVHGDPGAWKTICKASSEKQGWMKSTKALDLGQFGCLVQVTTEKRNPDGSTSLAEALTYVPGMRLIQIPGQAPKPQAAPGSAHAKK